MKILHTFKREYILEDDEAENIVNVLENKSNGFIKLRNGSMINIASISEISDIPKVARYKGYDVVNGRWYYRDGDKIHIDCPEDIEYIDDPKYKKGLLQLNS